jgi:hypothetical protein
VEVDRLEDRLVLSTTKVVTPLVPPAESASQVIQVIHTKDYAPLLSNLTAQVRNQANLVRLGKTTLAQAQTTLSQYAATAVSLLNADVTLTVQRGLPFRFAPINTGLTTINTNMGNSILQSIAAATSAAGLNKAATQIGVTIGSAFSAASRTITRGF